MASRSEQIRARIRELESPDSSSLSRSDQIRNEIIRRQEAQAQGTSLDQISISPAPEERRLPEISPSGLQKVADFTEKLPILPIAGSIVGEALASRIPGGGALFKLGTRSLGSGLGGVGGLFADEATRGGLPTTGEVIGEGIAGTVAPGLGGLTKRIARPVRTLFEPFLKSLSPGARVANKNLARYGESLMFSQATSSRLFNVAENVARSALTSVSKVEEKLQRQAIATVTEKGFAGEVLGQFLTGRRSNAEIGNIFTLSHAAKEKFNKGIAEAAYARLDALVKDVPVVDFDKILLSLPDKSRRTVALFNSTVKNRNTKIAERSLPSTQTRKGRGALFGEPATIDVPRSVQEITFSAAKKVRTDFLELGRRLRSRSAISPTEMAEINQVIKSIDKQMETAATTHGFVDEWRASNATYTKFRETFHNDFIKELVKAKPSEVGKKLASITVPEDVVALKRAISPDALKDVQGAFLANLAEEASTITTGLEERGTRQLMGKKLKVLLKLKGDRADARRELLGAEIENNLKRLADQAFLIEEKQSAGLGSMAVQLAQARGVTSIAGGVGATLLTGDPGLGIFTGATIFLGPVGLQKLLTSKKGMALLLEGLPLETGTSEGVKLATRIALFLGVPREENITDADIAGFRNQSILQARNPRLSIRQ